MTFAEAGVIEFAARQETVTLADADFAGSATLVATTVTAPLGGMSGAVYVAVLGPVALSEPFVPPPPFAPFTLHVTAEFALPLTVAVKLSVPAGGTFTAPGVMVTAIPPWI